MKTKCVNVYRSKTTEGCLTTHPSLPDFLYDSREDAKQWKDETEEKYFVGSFPVEVPEDSGRELISQIARRSQQNPNALTPHEIQLLGAFACGLLNSAQINEITNPNQGEESCGTTK